MMTLNASLIDMRFRPVRLIRSLFMVVLILFVFLNLHVLMNFEPRNTEIYDRTLLYKLRHSNILNAHVQIDRSQLSDLNNQDNYSKVEVLILPNEYNQTFVSNKIQEHNLTEIKKEIDRRNSEQYVHNLQEFGLSLGPESVVIVVQVHDRANYLKILLDSLRKVKGIEKTLLIFSHDVFSQELNSIIQSIDFCPVMQIYFPVSAQLHPKEFPGEHPNDCPRNVKKDQAIKLKCNNANHPDKYGHYREAKYCQTKHHWFWKLFHVFDELTVMKNYTGLVLLLEEDYYVAPDVITILQMMNHLKKRLDNHICSRYKCSYHFKTKDCKDCRMLTAGNYDKTQSYSLNSGKVELGHWISSRHNMGMTFTKDLWKEIKKCSSEFCNFDDYNWDWTLQHLSMKCIPDKIKVMKMKATRVFHIGECGVHHKGKNCQPDNKKKQIEGQLQSNKHHLFPNVLAVGGQSKFKLRDPKPNGGWGDIRDRELCLSFAKGYH